MTQAPLTKILDPADGTAVRQAAELLVVEFAKWWPDAWPTIDDALVEVRDCLADGYVTRVVGDPIRKRR